MKKYKISFRLLFSFSIISSLLLTSCAKKVHTSNSSYNFKSTDGIPDYSNLNYWAAHPWKKDPSDSVPKALQVDMYRDSLADVFFVHPTTFTDASEKNRNANIDDKKINEKTDYSTILYQASVFNNSARVFAPRYRQAHIRAFFNSNSDSEKAFDIAYADVKKAFTFYLTNYNNGRPIIIASHSQGTRHAAMLLKEFFENKQLLSQLVCAYIIGLPVNTDYFTSLKPCADSVQNGCFVTWRTFKRNTKEPEFFGNEKKSSVVVNPLTWTMSPAFAAASLNKGAVLRNFNKIVPHAVNAQIHNNILWTSKPDVPGKIFFIKKNYHVGDINLFYMNIRENAVTRTKAFLKKSRPTN